jgi:broad specificity phosphatase PhoE
MTPAFLIRHGETEWSRDHRHTGRTDIPLTPVGEQQARSLKERLAGPAFAHVLTSPLRRAIDTSTLAGFGATATVVANLREWDCGEYEGLTLAEIHTSRPGWNIFLDGCPGGELPDEISARADAVVDLLQSLDGPVALFSHAHFLCALAARWIGMTAREGGRFRLDTGRFGILDVEHANPAEPSIAGWNLFER